MRRVALCVLIAFSGCRHRSTAAEPESSPLVKAYAATVEKVRADIESDVSDDRLSDDIAAAKAADATLAMNPNLKRESIGHLLRAFSFYESASWSRRVIHRSESRNDHNSATVEQAQKDFEQSKTTADAEMGLAHKDLAAGR